MAVLKTTSVLRSYGDGEDGKGSRRYNHRIRAGERHRGKGSSEMESAAAYSCTGKFLLVGAVLAIQFVGAAAISSKGECAPFKWLLKEC